MEPNALHTVSPELVRAYLAESDRSLESIESDAQLNAFTAGLGIWLCQRTTTFAALGLSLTSWEARIDRGISMMLRPPARLFHEAGVNMEAGRRLPIRLDPGGAMMGGAYIPARLMPQVDELLERKLDVTVRRMAEAEMDAVWMQTMMMEAVKFARSHGLGLYESSGIIDAGYPASWPRGGSVVADPTNREIANRAEAVLKPPKEPGKIRRFFSRS